jgi:hypothetical protein
MRTMFRRLIRFGILAGIASLAAKAAQQATQQKASPAPAGTDFPDVPKND